MWIFYREIMMGCVTILLLYAHGSMQTITPMAHDDSENKQSTNEA